VKLIAALILLGAPLAAQIHLGLKGGVPLTDVTEVVGSGSILSNKPSRWTFGPMAELDLPFGLGVEADILYRRVGFENESGETTSSLWDFPILAKYRFPGVGARPYLGAGYSYRRLNDLLRLSSSHNGYVFVGGLRINAIAIKISPEVRYTRWTNEDIQPGFRANRNQAEVLVGVTF
jgi:hypothetical protein